MTFAEETALRCSIVLLAGLLAHLACRRRSPALRHAVLAATVVAAILVVPLSLVLPAVAVPVPTERTTAGATTPVADVPTPNALRQVPAPREPAAVDPVPWRALALWAWPSAARARRALGSPCWREQAVALQVLPGLGQEAPPNLDALPSFLRQRNAP